MNILEPRKRRAQRRSSAIGLLSADDTVAEFNAKRYSGKNGSYMERIRQGMENVHHSMETQLEMARNNIVNNANKGGEGGNEGPETAKFGASTSNLGLSISGAINNLVTKASVAAAGPALGTVVGAEAKDSAWASMEDDDTLSNMDRAADSWANNALNTSFEGFDNGFPEISSEFKSFEIPAAGSTSAAMPSADAFGDDGFFQSDIQQFDPNQAPPQTAIQSFETPTSATADNLPSDPQFGLVDAPQFDPAAIGGDGADKAAKSDETAEKKSKEKSKSSGTRRSKHRGSRSSRSRSRSGSRSRSRSRSHSRKRRNNARSHTAVREANSKKEESQVKKESSGDKTIKATSRHRSTRGTRPGSSRSFNQKTTKDQLSQSEHGRRRVSRSISMQQPSTSQSGDSKGFKESTDLRKGTGTKKPRSSRDKLSQSEHTRSRESSRPRSTRLRTPQVGTSSAATASLSQTEHKSSRDSARTRSSRTGKPSQSQATEDKKDAEASNSNRRSRQSVSDRRSAFGNRRSHSFRNTNSRSKQLDSGKKLKGDETKEDESGRQGRKTRGLGLVRSSSMDAAELRQTLYGGEEKVTIRRKLKAGSTPEVKADTAVVSTAVQPKAATTHGREETLRQMSVDGNLAW